MTEKPNEITTDRQTVMKIDKQKEEIEKDTQ